MEFGSGLLLSLKTTSKPIATIESKQYRMVNHFYNYPGLVKWEPISMTFVDGKLFAGGVVTETEGVAPPQDRMTSTEFWRMLIGSGYTPPSYSDDDVANYTTRFAGISSPEKASMMDISFGDKIRIHQLSPEGRDANGMLDSVETWELWNPIITKLSWGDLSYDSDDFIEYSMDITYDWAVMYDKNPNAATE